MNRSENMRRIKSRDTGPEMTLRRALHQSGLRYRCSPSTTGSPAQRLPARPDIMFSTSRLAVFVHGCFWHQHAGCPKATQPKTNRDYWDSKLRRNIERDERTMTTFAQCRIDVLVVWECEIRRDVAVVADAIERKIIRRT